MAYVIKRYSNRKLYDTQESRYVTLEEIEEMIRAGREITVVDAASKAGVAAFTKSLAKELAGRGVTVNAIAPGFIETEMVAAIPEKVKERLLAQIPLKRFGTAEEVARAVVYIVSSDGDYITGAELSINGGLLM